MTPSLLRMETNNRHSGTQHLAQFFDHAHLPPDLACVSKLCHDFAVSMITVLDDGPELTAGLRKLLEAKDCFVRAALPSEPSP